MAIIPKGQEPANVKKRIETLFPKLDGAYPDKVIISLQRDHKKWDETAREISKQLGYANKNDFLTAYGYKIEKLEGGRPSGDHMAIIDELKKRYPNGSSFAKIDELKAANPDLAPKFKTISNNSKALFGMTFADYLKSIGLLATYVTQAEIKAINKEYILISVEFCESGTMQYYLSPTKTIVIDEFVEVINDAGKSEFAKVCSVEKYRQDNSPVPISSLTEFVRKIKVNEIKEFMYKHTHSYHEKIRITSLLSKNVKDAINSTDELFISWAVIRGTIKELNSIYEKLSKMESGFKTKVYFKEDIIPLNDTIAEFILYCDDVQYVVQDYPNIKAAMFIENISEKNVCFAYSKCGENTISVCNKIGDLDPEEESKWTLLYSPVENFKIPNQSGQCYEFSMLDDWNAKNYEVNLDE